jgi:NADH-quinone oxidoreductase subunit C
MDETLQIVAHAMQSRFGAEVLETRGEVTLFLPPQRLIQAAKALKEEFGFDMLMDLTAVDYWPQTKPRFHLVYQLYSFGKNLQLRLRTGLDGNAPTMDTIETLYPNANWFEREVFDMFGIRFNGHSDMRRIIMPYDWQGHPLRKDYPLGYEEVEFTFNFDEIERKKPYAKE